MSVVEKNSAVDLSERHARAYAKYRNSLFRYLVASTGEEAAAEDLLSETFTAFLESFDDFSRKNGAAKWLWTAARFRLLRYYEKQNTERKRLVFADFEEFEPAAPEPPPAGALSREEIEELLRRLPEEAATAIYLFYFEDMSLADMARVLDIAEGTVKSRLYRGLRKFAGLARAKLAQEKKRSA